MIWPLVGVTLTLILEASADFVHFWRHDDAHKCVWRSVLGGKRRAEAESRSERSKSERTANMDRREKHNERHRRYRARRREQEEERNRELANLREFYGVMLDSCFTAVAFYEMMRIYRDRPEAYLEDTVKLLEILPMLNLQWRRTSQKKKEKKPGSFKSHQIYERI